LAVEFLKSNGATELYDGVILPALALAEEDRHKGALEPGREEFIVQSINEFILEVPQLVEDIAAGSGKEAESGKEQVQTHPERPCSVLCLAAADQADEIAAAMLVQLLDAAGHTASCLSVADSRSERIEHLPRELDRAIDIVLISALPPFALLSAHTVSKRAHIQYPKADIIIGLWQFSSDSKRADERLDKVFPDPVVTSLADAVARIESESGAHDPESRQDLPVAV
jgi:hypothetical protein